MWKKILAAAVAAASIAVVPAGLLLILVTVSALPTTAACSDGRSLPVGRVPGSLTVRTTTGTTITLDGRQLTRAATILAVGGRTPGMGARGARIALMAALTESGLRMLANPTVPGSTSHPNDGIGSDHDSLGLFQMRPSTGWGTADRLMDPTYQAEAFFGGPNGPNHGSPAGLADIHDWTALTDAQAAQAVEVSAYPDRYATFAPAADRIINSLTAKASGGSGPPIAETGRVVFPLPAGTWALTARFGPRVDPITGLPGFHHGTDLAAAGGTPIRSATDGRVITARLVGGTGTIVVLATVDGAPTVLTYLHMPADGIAVQAGQAVTAGQVIGAVGSTGHSTGPHLHFQVQPGGISAPSIDSLTWLRAHHATTTSPGQAAASTTCG